jgi:hypothetical protein
MSLKTVHSGSQQRQRRGKEGSARGCGLTLSFSAVRPSQLRCVNYLGGWRERGPSLLFQCALVLHEGVGGSAGRKLVLGEQRGGVGSGLKSGKRLSFKRASTRRLFPHKQDQLLGRCRRSARKRGRKGGWMVVVGWRTATVSRPFCLSSKLAGRPKRLLDLSRT